MTIQRHLQIQLSGERFRVSILDTLIGLAVAQVIGLFIFIIYKKR